VHVHPPKPQNPTHSRINLHNLNHYRYNTQLAPMEESKTTTTTTAASQDKENTVEDKLALEQAKADQQARRENAKEGGE